jgi:hypothetical protein
MNKKLFFALPIAAMALASCSNDNELASAPSVPTSAPLSQEIQFFPVAQGTTRGALAQDAGITDTLSTTVKLPGSSDYGKGYGYFYVQTKGYYYDKLQHNADAEDGNAPNDDILKERSLKRYVSYNPDTKSWSIQTIFNNADHASATDKLGNLYWQDNDEQNGSLDETAKAYEASFVAYAGLDQRMYANNILSNAAQTVWTEPDVYAAVNNFDPTNGVEVSVNNIVQNQRDVAVAFHQDKQENLKKDGVPLHFRHAMSQIVFQGAYAIDEELTKPLAEPEKNLYAGLQVYVKEAVVVNAANNGKLVGPTISTAEGQSYNADWTKWKDVTIKEDVYSWHPGWASWTGETYGAKHFQYISSRLNPVGLEKDAQLIDNSDNAAYGPMLLMPQTTLAAEEVPAHFASTKEDAVKQGAYLMLKVNIQRKVKIGDTDYWCQWYPAVHGNDAYSVDNIFDAANLYTKAKATADASAATEAKKLSDIQDVEAAWDYIAIPIKYDWKPGYRYTFQINFSNFAAGWFAPDTNEDNIPYKTDGTHWATSNDPVIPGVHKPVSFTVTVESAWENGGIVKPLLQ